MKKYTWIDSLKGIAICGVIMVHSGVSVLPFPIGRLGCGGAYGVYIFLVLSAFLAYHSLENTFGDENFSVKDLYSWWARKFIRLIPVFYLAVLLALLYQKNDSDGIIGNIIAHLLFVFGLFPNYINSILSVEWYLGILAIFYILVPILYRYINSLRRAGCFLGISFIICEIINSLVIKNVSGGYVYESFFGTFWLFEQIPSLSLGIVLFFLLKLPKISTMKRYPLMILIILSSTIVLSRLFGISQHSLLVNYTFCSVIAVCLALLLNTHRYIVLDNICWRTLGKYSYPIYLLHCLILYVYDRYIFFHTGNVFIDWGVKYIVTVIIALVTAVIITRYWDEPMQEVLVGIYNKVKRKKSHNE